MEEYELTCTDCEFTVVVTGTIEEVYDQIAEHQTTRESDLLDHAVDFVRLDK